MTITVVENRTQFIDDVVSSTVVDSTVLISNTVTSQTTQTRTHVAINSPQAVIITATAVVGVVATVTSSPSPQTILRTQFIAATALSTVFETEINTVIQTAPRPPDVISTTVTPTSTVVHTTTNLGSTEVIVSAPNVATVVQFAEVTTTVPAKKRYVTFSIRITLSLMGHISGMHRLSKAALGGTIAGSAIGGILIAALAGALLCHCKLKLKVKLKKKEEKKKDEFEKGDDKEKKNVAI